MLLNNNRSTEVNILIIDDERSAGKLMKAALSINSNCEVVDCAEQAIEKLKTFIPHVIVMDIHMPGIDGYDLCKTLKRQESFQNTGILFISGDNTLEKRLQAFDVGGDDFIAKPFEVRELQRKTARLAEFVMQRQSLVKQEEESRKVAIESMQLASEYGNVMAFFKEMYQAQNIDSIVQLFFRAMQKFELKTSIMVNIEWPMYFDSTHDRISPIEHSVYELLTGKGRLYQFGKRMILNDKYVSFIVKNMPDDETLSGHIRDYCAALIEGMSARIETIKKQLALKKIIDNLQNETDCIDSYLELLKNQNEKTLQDISHEISHSFHFLDLNEEQEDTLSKIIERQLDKNESVSDQLMVLKNKLITMKDEATLASQGFEQPHKRNVDTKDNSQDVELF